jgi:nucleoside-diphosphate-sugar epimerase
MKQRIVVLGAGGFVGRRVIAALAASDWAQPVATIHRSPAALPAGVERIGVDATVEAGLERALAGATGVVNCVTGTYETIVAGANALFAIAARSTAKLRVVHMSSMAVYGSATGTLDENAALRGDLGPYSAAKVEAEKRAADAGNVVCLRPGIVYGPTSPQWCELIGRLLLARRLGDLGIAGDGICNLVHVDDVARAALLALRTPGIEGQAFNLGLPFALTWNDYFLRYAKALGAVPVRRIGPTRLMLELKVLGPTLKIAEIVTRTIGLPAPPAPIRPWLQQLCRHPIYLRVTKAEEKLGMRWLPLDEGLREVAAWFRTEVAA